MLTCHPIPAQPRAISHPSYYLPRAKHQVDKIPRPALLRPTGRPWAISTPVIRGRTRVGVGNHGDKRQVSTARVRKKRVMSYHGKPAMPACQPCPVQMHWSSKDQLRSLGGLDVTARCKGIWKKDGLRKKVCIVTRSSIVGMMWQMRDTRAGWACDSCVKDRRDGVEGLF